MLILNSLELFAGAGGLATGISEHKVRHRAFIEWNRDACATLQCNYDRNLILNTDIRSVDFAQFGSVELVSGGPPCQPFSLGGKHGGVMDPRDMFPYACKAIAVCRPRAFIFENVKGLLRKSFSSYCNYIILRLSYPELEIKDSEKWEDHLYRLEEYHTLGSVPTLKYRVLLRLVDAADYGIPQRRERVVIVGFREDLHITWNFPKATHSLEAMIWDQYIDGSYWDRHGVQRPTLDCYDRRMRSLIERSQANAKLFPPVTKAWRTIRDQLSGIPQPDKEGSFHSEHVLREGARIYPGHTGSFLDLPSKTIKAGDHGVPGGENMIRFHDGRVRYFTVYEAKIIQSFPETYKIVGSWTESMRQIGNAVPVKLASVIAQSVIDALKNKSFNDADRLRCNERSRAPAIFLAAPRR